MKLDIYEKSEALQKYTDYRDLQLQDCVHLKTPAGLILVFFNCPEVKGLADERYTLTPSVNSPGPIMPAKLFLDIEIPGKRFVKVAFPWESGIPQGLLEASYLVFLTAKKPDYIKKGNSMTALDLYKLAGSGCLDIDLASFRKNFEAVIVPIELMVRLGLSPIDVEGRRPKE